MRVLVLAVLLVACSPMVYVHGVPNLALVEDGVYRSGQISSSEGWDYIATLAAGRRIHVVKLNFDHEGSDYIAVVRAWDVHYLPIDPQGDQDIWDDLLSAFRGPDPNMVRNALDVLRACHDHPTRDLCLVHCTHGQDRTGLVIGEYRVVVDKWSKKDAHTEMLNHHFHPELHGLEEAWEEFAEPR